MDIDARGEAPIVESIPFAVVLGGMFGAHLALAWLATGWELAGSVAPPVWFASAFTAAVALLLRPQRRWLAVATGLAAQSIHALMHHDDGTDAIGDVVANGVEIAAAVVLFGVIFVPTPQRGFHATTALAFAVSIGVASAGALVAAWWLGAGEGFGRWFWSWTGGHALGMVVVGATVMLFREARGWMDDVAERGSHLERIITIVGSTALAVGVLLAADPLSPLVVIPLAWLAVRFGPAASFPGAVIAVALTSAITAAGHGAIASADDPVRTLAALNWALAFAGVFIGRYTRSIDYDRLREAAMIRVLPDPISVVNRAGDPVDRLVGSIDPADTERLRAAAASMRTAAIESNTVTTDEIEMASGRTLELRMIGLDDDHVLSIARDVTDSVSMRERLQRATDHWKRIASTAYEGFAEVDHRMRVTFVSERWAEMLGVDRTDLEGRVFSDMFAPEDWITMAPYAAAALSGDRVTFEEEIQRPDGSRLWVLVSADPKLDADGRLESCVLFAADTSEHHREHARRVAAEAELASLERRERARIGRVLHDGPLQTVVALSYRLSRLSKSVADLEPLEAMALEAIRQMRGSLDDLRPPRVDDGGLTAALVGVAERYRTAAGPTFVVRDDTTPPVSEHAAGAVFRIGREAIANAMVHADAHAVTASIVAVDEGLQITVTDDGRGFTDVGPRDGHLGLGLIRERARDAGGSSRVDSSASGTVVVAWVPDEAPAAIGGRGGERSG
ncbi:MAG: PAS domain S-box protein [Actinomycetota bacterium]